MPLQTYSKGFTNAPTAGGKTAGTFDLIDSITVPKKKFDVFLYGFDTLIATQIVTAGQSGHPIIQFDSADFGLSKERKALPRFGFTDPIATNNLFTPVASEFIPFFMDQPVNNKTFDVSLSSSATMTGQWDCHTTAIFGNMPPADLPADYLAELLNGFEASISGRYRREDDAALALGSADTDVALTSISLLSIDKEILGFEHLVIPNAPTASEEIVSLFKYRSGTINMDPQEYVGCVAFNPELGTAVGGPKALLMSRMKPARFPLPESNFSLEVVAQNVIALTNAPDMTQQVKVRI